MLSQRVFLQRLIKTGVFFKGESHCTKKISPLVEDHCNRSLSLPASTTEIVFASSLFPFQLLVASAHRHCQLPLSIDIPFHLPPIAHCICTLPLLIAHCPMSLPYRPLFLPLFLPITLCDFPWRCHNAPLVLPTAIAHYVCSLPLKSTVALSLATEHCHRPLPLFIAIALYIYPSLLPSHIAIALAICHAHCQCPFPFAAAIVHCCCHCQCPLPIDVVQYNCP